MSDEPGAADAPDGTGVRLAVVTSRFNESITDAMRRAALETAAELGCDVVVDVRAPGVYDLPLVIDTALARDDVDVAVALGAIVTGETGHDELIGHAAGHELTRIAVRRAKPVGLGVTGPRQTRDQAQARVARAADAVRAAVAQLRTRRALDEDKS